MKIRLGELRRLIREELQVATFVGASNIQGAGDGLYAAEDIERGATVFSWNPQVDSEYSSDYPDSLPIEDSKKFKELASWDGDTWSLAGDGAAYFNHADNPNVRVVDDKSKPAKRNRVAARNIRRGEELTMDYNEIGTDLPIKL